MPIKSDNFMKRILISSVPSVAFTLSLLAATIALSAVAEEKAVEAGFKSLFNGRDQPKSIRRRGTTF
ncbi:MAG: hypothetical protein DME22_19560 [Verrucomicrobia bacterium]|nr:MAG: hypothetical protein DME22_19560 [Verrucomicrobiota bacterium]